MDLFRLSEGEIADLRRLCAEAFDEGVREMSRALQGGPEPVNPYRER